MFTWQIDQNPTNLPGVFHFTVWKLLARPWGNVRVFLDTDALVQYCNVLPRAVFMSRLEAVEAINQWERENLPC